MCRFIFFVCVFGVFGGCGQNRSVPSLNDKQPIDLSDAIIDAPVELEPETHQSFVQIVREKIENDPNATTCSGTLIAPRIVLTAAHCLRSVSDQGPWRLTVRIPTSSTKFQNILVTDPNSVVVHGSWVNRTAKLSIYDGEADGSIRLACDGEDKPARIVALCEQLRSECDRQTPSCTMHSNSDDNQACDDSIRGNDELLCAMTLFAKSLAPEQVLEACPGASAACIAQDANAHLKARNSLLGLAIRLDSWSNTDAAIGHDIGLLLLPEAVSIAPMVLPNICWDDVLGHGTQVEAYGYGSTVMDVLHPLDGLNHTEEQFGQRKMQGVIADKSDALLWVQAGRFYGTPALCAGDSGASILAYHATTPLVIGIASSSAEHFGLCMNGTVATRVSSYLSWISAEMNAWHLAPPEMVSCCGNGVIESPETCDDGNVDNLDSCTNTCEIARCGDNTIQRDELCDGNCPTSCDDGDVCTMDRVLGSGTCQVRCANTYEESLCPERIPGCTMFDAGVILWPLVLWTLRRRRMA